MENITFRELIESDYKLLQKWVNADFVKKWCFKSINWTYDEIIKMFTYIKESKNDSFTVLCGKNKIGYIQKSSSKDDSEYFNLLQIDGNAADIGLMFIGEVDYIHKGLGSIIIKKFLKEIIFKDIGIDKCIICPELKNSIAIKSYEKAGFKYIRTTQIPEENEPFYVMEILRDEI
ncbi:MAG: GNAT family N-acetyltransferase [Treponema sp.]|nr:GNAT family N-acetyltransferase [Treponema sp.]